MSLDLDDHGLAAALADDVAAETASSSHHEEGGNEEGVENNASPTKKGKKKRDASTLRKCPTAPKRFKSSYICFFMAKQPEIKEELGDKATVTEISKRSAQMWKGLSQQERSHWDDVAAKDKQRYMVEKASYTGPWQVPFKRARKDPSAPKRPMSAFLYFSQGRRRQLKDANPNMKNTEVSRLLGEMWRNAPEEEKRPHIEKEKEEREKYKVAIADWRKEHDERMEKERKAQAEQAAYVANMYPTNHEGQPQPYAGYGDPNMPPQYSGQPPAMGGPPPGAGYGYGGPGYPPPYSYPPGPYQYPTNGKQPVILGPSGTPRYPPPAMNYGQPPPPSHHMQQGAPPPSHQYGPPQGYDMNQQPPPPQHLHYDYPPPEQHHGMDPSPHQQPHHYPQQQPHHHQE